jgi:hypothetical protein
MENGDKKEIGRSSFSFKCQKHSPFHFQGEHWPIVLFEDIDLELMFIVPVQLVLLED